MSIAALAHEMIDLQQASKRLLDAGDIEDWLNSLYPEFAVAERLRSHLLNSPFVVTDDPAVKQILSDIELTDIENKDKVGAELLFSWINPAEYVARLAQVTVLITPFQIPANLECFIEEARQCYAFGQYSAVQALSRTILEAAVNDIAVRIKKMPKEALDQDLFMKWPPKKRFLLVAETTFKQVYDHYRDLCQVVHGLDTSAVSGPLGSLTKTIGFVQHFYERHRIEIRSNEPIKPPKNLGQRQTFNAGTNITSVPAACSCVAKANPLGTK